MNKLVESCKHDNYILKQKLMKSGEQVLGITTDKAKKTITVQDYHDLENQIQELKSRMVSQDEFYKAKLFETDKLNQLNKNLKEHEK